MHWPGAPERSVSNSEAQLLSSQYSSVSSPGGLLRRPPVPRPSDSVGLRGAQEPASSASSEVLLLVLGSKSLNCLIHTGRVGSNTAAFSLCFKNQNEPHNLLVSFLRREVETVVYGFMCSQHSDPMISFVLPSFISCFSSSRGHRVQAGCGHQRHEWILVFSKTARQSPLRSPLPPAPSPAAPYHPYFHQESVRDNLSVSYPAPQSSSSLYPKPRLHFQVFFIASSKSRYPRHDSRSQRPGPG